VVENITQFCWRYSSSIQQWKNFENRLRFEKVIAKSLVASFFWDTVYIPPIPPYTATYWPKLAIHVFYTFPSFDVPVSWPTETECEKTGMTDGGYAATKKIRRQVQLFWHIMQYSCRTWIKCWQSLQPRTDVTTGFLIVAKSFTSQREP